MIDTKEIPVTLVNFNARSELNGEDRKPAADISCRATMPASMLETLIPGICAAMYKTPDMPDLVDQAGSPAPTSLCFPMLAMPLKIIKEFTGYGVEIDYGLGGDSNKRLHECKIHKFAVTFMEGGSADLSWMISTHPDTEMAGWLYDNPDLKTTMIFHAPEQPQADMLAPKRLSKKEKSDAALAEAQAIFEGGAQAATT